MSGAKPPVAVVGAGRMGRGIAHVFAYAGHHVTLVDVKERPSDQTAAVLAEARREIDAGIAFLATLGVLSEAQSEAVLGRISFLGPDGHDGAVEAAEVVFEAVPEVMATKRTVLGRIAAAARPDTVIASATSTIEADTLAELVAGPERFLNAHWLNPAYLVPLVEVSAARETAPEITARLVRLLEAAGKVPVVCAASPGFIVPRIQALAMNEAARLVEEGVASADDIDKATRLGLGFRFAVLGLLEFIDWGGGDILHYASDHLAEALGDERFRAPEVVRRNMATGAVGMKTGRGFHDFSDRDVDAYRRETLAKFVALAKHLGLLPPPGGIDRD